MSIEAEVIDAQFINKDIFEVTIKTVSMSSLFYYGNTVLKSKTKNGTELIVQEKSCKPTNVLSNESCFFYKFDHWCLVID